MSENQPTKTITARWLSERGIQTGALLSFRVLPHEQQPFPELLEIAMSVRGVYHGLGNVVPGFHLRVSRGRPRIRSSRAPWRFPCLPCVMDEPIVCPFGSFAAIGIPGFHPEGKQKRVGTHMASFRGGSSANQAWQRRPFPLMETAKSNDNRGGWAKSSTTIEVIEPFVFAFSCIQFVDN